MRRRLLVLLPVLLLASCMSLVLKAPESPVPVSLSGQIKGYRSARVIRHLVHEIWVYQLLGLPQMPAWTLEGLSPDELVSPLLKEATSPSQGLIRLKLRQSRTPVTWLATILTLGLLSPTSVTIEADLVELESVNSEQ